MIGYILGIRYNEWIEVSIWLYRTNLQYWWITNFFLQSCTLWKKHDRFNQYKHMTKKLATFVIELGHLFCSLIAKRCLSNITTWIRIKRYLSMKIIHNEHKTNIQSLFPFRLFAIEVDRLYFIVRTWLADTNICYRST